MNLCFFEGLRPWQQDLIKKAYSEPSFRRTRQRINQLVEEESWSSELKGVISFTINLSIYEFYYDTAFSRIPS